MHEYEVEVDGSDLDRDRARISVGVTARMSDAVQSSFNYDGELAGSDDHHAVSATLRYTW